MKGIVTICIGTIGSTTFEKCKSNVYKMAAKDSRVDRIVVIENVRPQFAWLNQMRLECRDTKWCLQVDEDMYLKPHALNRLLSFAEEVESKGHRILNASSLLYDIFLKEKVGSLKLWSSEALQSLDFRDVLGGDRDYAERAKKLGYKNFSIEEVLGYHDSAPTPAIAFSKYYEYTQKIRKFKSDGAARRFSNSLKRRWQSDGLYISKKAYDGSKRGLIDPLVNKTKSG